MEICGINGAPRGESVREIADARDSISVTFTLQSMAQAFGKILASEGRFERGRQFVVVTGDILEWLTGKKCRSESK